MCTLTAALKLPSMRACAGVTPTATCARASWQTLCAGAIPATTPPAAITVHLVDGEGCRITVAPKGFGSENMSQIKMLKPADGVEGFKKFVLDTVKLAGSNPCPPIVLGIGVGGSFDKVAYLAKKALLRPLDVPNPDPYYAQLEQELLAAINELGIGPQGFGGRTTCLGLAIEQMPTHVAGLPAAVNVSCHVTRRASAEL